MVIYIYVDVSQHLATLDEDITELVTETSLTGTLSFSDLNRFSNLQSIYMYDNRITGSFPAIDLPQLRSLTISYSSIESIDEFMSDLPQSLTEINIDNCYLPEINITTGRNNLKSLRLQNNQISELRGIERLSGLDTLNVSYNNLSRIRNLERLVLTFLDISYNNMRKINVDSRQLVYFNCSFNRFKKIQVSDTMRIKYLIISNNELTEANDLKEINPDLLDISDNPKLDMYERLRLTGLVDISYCPYCDITIHNPYSNHVYHYGSPVTVDRFDPAIAYSS